MFLYMGVKTSHFSLREDFFENMEMSIFGPKRAENEQKHRENCAVRRFKIWNLCALCKGDQRSEIIFLSELGIARFLCNIADILSL